MSFDLAAVKTYLQGLQEELCSRLGSLDGAASFGRDEWTRSEGGGGCTRVLTDGKIFEKAGVAFSHVFGDQLPGSSTLHRPELSGKKWEAVGVSLVIHPKNPYVPTAHANIRCFVAGAADASPVWWFGGGMDLTPYYGFEADARHWHQVARTAVDPFGLEIYPRFKTACDDYFYLRHRQERRGVGGLFFDDFNQPGFEKSFGLAQAVGNAFLPAYLPIVSRRNAQSYGERERQFQLYRRGRYVEFNLVWDRGTLFGLQSAGRTESILMSMPPLVRWEYNFQAEVGSPEADLVPKFLTPRNWLADATETGGARPVAA